MSQNHEHTVGFFVPNNATPDQIGKVIDSIQRYFGVQSAPGVTPAAAVAAQGTTSQPPITGIVLDSSGMPWDERVHSSAKSQKNDGTWTKRKGVDDATYARVTTELRATMAATGTTAAAPALPTTAAAAPTLPTLPQTGPVVPALPQTAPTAYQNFVAWIGTQLHSPQNPAGRLTGDWVDTVITNNGVAGGLANLGAREDLIPAIEAQIRGVLGA